MQLKKNIISDIQALQELEKISMNAVQDSIRFLENIETKKLQQIQKKFAFGRP